MESYDPTVQFNYLGAFVLVVLSIGMLLISSRVYGKKDIAG